MRWFFSPEWKNGKRERENQSAKLMAVKRIRINLTFLSLHWNFHFFSKRMKSGKRYWFHFYFNEFTSIKVTQKPFLAEVHLKKRIDKKKSHYWSNRTGALNLILYFAVFKFNNWRRCKIFPSLLCLFQWKRINICKEIDRWKRGKWNSLTLGIWDGIGRRTEMMKSPSGRE